MPFHPTKPAVEGITLCCYSGFRKAFLFRAVLKHTLNFNDMLNSHLNMQWSATFEFAPLWANIMGSSNLVALENVLNDSQSKVKPEEFIQKSHVACWWDLQRGQFCLGIFKPMVLPFTVWSCPGTRSDIPFISLSRKDIWINNISLIQ